MSSRMCTVGVSFTVGAEIGVWADSTLVTISANITWLGLAKRSIASDVAVKRFGSAVDSNVLIERSETMSRMDLFGTQYTS